MENVQSDSSMPGWESRLHSQCVFLGSERKQIERSQGDHRCITLTNDHFNERSAQFRCGKCPVIPTSPGWESTFHPNNIFSEWYLKEDLLSSDFYPVMRFGAFVKEQYW
ncbi:hypothetical protein CEXT_487581 [Caerostris extrusa]|uniref:Uncharacterized protein n=1 Tax=Caerostris extrusa TaxID=172846 RepID=A0AAV4Q6F1_CAEEX|nr:hypothetical protein CEXT_487581 [Caerostris extrusa]